MSIFKTYVEALESLPECDIEWTSSFGYPGEGGYTEFWRTSGGRRFTISNGKWSDIAPFTWTVAEVTS